MHKEMSGRTIAEILIVALSEEGIHLASFCVFVCTNRFTYVKTQFNTMNENKFTEHSVQEVIRINNQNGNIG